MRIGLAILSSTQKPDGERQTAMSWDPRQSHSYAIQRRELGRKRELKHLAHLASLHSTIALSGLSGSGKSRLATRYVLQEAERLDREPPLIVVPPDLPPQSRLEWVLDEATAKGIKGGEAWQEASKRCSALVASLQQHNSFIVLDDAHNLTDSELELLFEASGSYDQLKFLVLTQRALLHTHIYPYPMPGLTRAEVQQLMELRDLRLDNDVLDRLHTATDGLPMAVHAFATTVQLGWDEPSALLEGSEDVLEMTREWFAEIERRLPTDLFVTLQFCSLAGHGFKKSRLYNQSLDLLPSNRRDALRRLLSYYLVEHLGASHYAVHSLVSSHALASLDPADSDRMLVALGGSNKISLFEQPGRKRELSLLQQADGLRAIDYYRRAGNVQGVAQVFDALAPALKKAGRYEIVSNTCEWLVAAGSHNPWHSYSLAQALVHLGHDYSTAQRLLEGLLETSTNSNLTLNSARVLAHLHYEAQRSREGLQTLEQVEQRIDSNGVHSHLLLWSSQTKLLLLADLGYSDEAHGLARRLRGSATARNDNLAKAIITVYLARVDVHEPARLERRLRESFRLLSSDGDLPARLLCQVWLARVRLASGSLRWKASVDDALSLGALTKSTSRDYRELVALLCTLGSNEQESWMEKLGRERLRLRAP